MGQIIRCWMLLAILLGFLVLPAQAQDETRVEQAVAFLTANHIPSTAYRELATALATTDHQAVSAVLVKVGYSPEQLKAFVTDMNLLLLDNALRPQPSDTFQVQGLELLQSYGLNGVDLQTLVPLVRDPAALTASLMDQGLTAEQAAQLLEQAAPIFEQGAAQGLMQYDVVNTQLFRFMHNAGLPAAMLYDSAHLLGDPAAVSAYLTEIGFSPDQIQTFVGMIPELAARGVTPDGIEGWTVRSMIYRLEGIGLPPQSIYEIVSLGNSDAVRGYLTAKGLSGDVLELAVVHLSDCMGYQGETLNLERLHGFQVREANALLESAGIATANMSIILALADHPEALSAYLAEAYALDEAQIAAFMAGLSQSTFAQTVNPDDTDAHLSRELAPVSA